MKGQCVVSALFSGREKKKKNKTCIILDDLSVIYFLQYLQPPMAFKDCRERVFFIFYFEN